MQHFTGPNRPDLAPALTPDQQERKSRARRYIGIGVAALVVGVLVVAAVGAAHANSGFHNVNTLEASVAEKASIATLDTVPASGIIVKCVQMDNGMYNCDAYLGRDAYSGGAIWKSYTIEVSKDGSTWTGTES